MMQWMTISIYRLCLPLKASLARFTFIVLQRRADIQDKTTFPFYMVFIKLSHDHIVCVCDCVIFSKYLKFDM